MAEKNERGNSVERYFLPVDRYYFDFGECEGWLQYDTDQDAHYFGIWVNKDKRQIITYAEGDVTTVTCPTGYDFNSEIASMNEFYAPGVSHKVIDAEGRLTIYRQDRETFYI